MASMFQSLSVGDKFLLKNSDSIYMKVSATYYRGETLVNAVNMNTGLFIYFESGRWTRKINVMVVIESGKACSST
jgi:hypothetical protein